MDKDIKRKLELNLMCELDDYAGLEEDQYEEKGQKQENMKEFLQMITKIEQEELSRAKAEQSFELEKMKLDLESKKLRYEKEKEKLRQETEKQKATVEFMRTTNDIRNSGIKERRDKLEKIGNVCLKMTEILLPLTVSIFMWYAQNRLIYIDDGRSTPELKEIIRSVNKKIF